MSAFPVALIDSSRLSLHRVDNEENSFAPVSIAAITVKPVVVVPFWAVVLSVQNFDLIQTTFLSAMGYAVTPICCTLTSFYNSMNWIATAGSRDNFIKVWDLTQAVGSNPSGGFPPMIYSVRSSNVNRVRWRPGFVSSSLLPLINSVSPAFRAALQP